MKKSLLVTLLMIAAPTWAASSGIYICDISENSGVGVTGDQVQVKLRQNKFGKLHARIDSFDTYQPAVSFEISMEGSKNQPALILAAKKDSVETSKNISSDTEDTGELAVLAKNADGDSVEISVNCKSENLATARAQRY